MNQKIFIIILFFLLVSIGCQRKKPVTKKEIIQQKIEKKVSNWANRTKDDCSEKVKERAEAIVDSILIANAFIGKDTLNKPVRPEKPAIKELDDTMNVVPLFEQDNAKPSIKKIKDTTINVARKIK